MKDQGEFAALSTQIAELRAHQIDMKERMGEMARLLSDKATSWDSGAQTAYRLAKKEGKWDTAAIVARVAAFMVSVITVAIATSFAEKLFKD